MPKNSILTDIRPISRSLRAHARAHIDAGAVSAGYFADRATVLELLNVAIDSYRDIIQYLGKQDPTTRRMMEGVLAVEEEHADELADLLVAFPDEAEGKSRSTKSQ